MTQESMTQFIITADSFVVDETGGKSDGALYDAFIADRYNALFVLGFSARPEGGSSLEFLYRLSSVFVDTLTDRSDLQLVRETISVLPDDGTCEKLMRVRPFCPGAEYISRGWIEKQFVQLSAVLSRELAAFPGTAAEYLSEKNKQLRIPERIFFHLVENRDDSFPFAFLATYAAEGTDGEVRHFPLSHALTEYRDDREKLLGLLSCLEKAARKKLLAQCSNKIENIESLISGTFPDALKELFYDKAGLFPSPREIRFNCTCPDWASLCKHVAAVLYGVGARFDEDPLLFFKLRGVDVNDFIDKAINSRVEEMLSHAGCRTDRMMDEGSASKLFDVIR
jgi:hypothetical protein